MPSRAHKPGLNSGYAEKAPKSAVDQAVGIGDKHADKQIDRKQAPLINPAERSEGSPESPGSKGRAARIRGPA